MRAVYRNGLIYPSEAVPPELSEGQEVRWSGTSRSPAMIRRRLSDGIWDLEWRRVGPMKYEAGERERVKSVLEEADRQAKEAVRRQMAEGL